MSAHDGFSEVMTDGPFAPSQTHRLALPLLVNEVVFKDRGEVEVKGAAKPLRMFLAISKQAVLASQGLIAIGMDLSG